MPDTPSYTVEQANSMLPWLRERLASLRSMQENVQVSVLVMQRLAAHDRKSATSTVGPDMELAERAIAGGRESMRGIFLELIDKGIELRDLEPGLVDFPSERDGRTVWLCWKLDEPGVAHWHELNSGFASRQPL